MTFGRWITGITLAALLSVPAAAAQAQDKAEVALRAAMERETVEGDLKAAIDQYKKLAQGKDRAVAAKALVHMGQCYEKLGDVEARKAYERAVRDFSDQTEAVATARARLAVLGKPAATTGATARLVWSRRGAQNPPSPKVLGPSPDGRFLLQYNQATLQRKLELVDLNTGQTRTLTEVGGQVESAAFSRNGRRIAFVGWINDIPELSTIGTDGGGQRMLWRGEKDSDFQVSGWFPDSRRILAQVWPGKAPCRLVAFSADDGSSMTLREGQCIYDPQLSPDGSFVVYSKRVRKDPRNDELWLLSLKDRTDILLLREAFTVEGPRWAPDGKGIVFTSDWRTPGKARDLWMLNIEDAKPQGRPELVRSDMQSAAFLGGITRSGSYYYRVDNGGLVERLATEFDPVTGKAVGVPAPVPAWQQTGVVSPDGRWWADLKWIDGAASLVMRSVETGQEKKFTTEFTSFYPSGFDRFFPDGRSLLVMARHRKDGWGFHRLDVTSGRSTLLKAGFFNVMIELSPDGKTLYHCRQSEEGQVQVLAHDLENGKERELLRGLALHRASNRWGFPGAGFPLGLSLDGTQLAVTRPDGTDAVLEVLPVSGGARREVYRVRNPEWLALVQWSRDARYLIFGHAPVIGGALELKQIPVEGGQVQNIGIGGTNGFSISRDGRRVEFSVNRGMAEVWALENFLPKAAK